MLKVSKTSVMNLENAIRGARNPLNSWARSDSTIKDGVFQLGEQDKTLTRRLCRAGSDHRKFIRQIFVSVDILAPIYWWKEYDTYKVGTVANSTSTMHKLHSKPLELDDFSHDHMTEESMEVFKTYLAYLEGIRKRFIEQNNKADWYDLIQLLPSSYQQLRTCSLNYEVLIHIYYARKEHKLEEWHTFCQWIEQLPYADDLILIQEKES